MIIAESSALVKRRGRAGHEGDKEICAAAEAAWNGARPRRLEFCTECWTGAGKFLNGKRARVQAYPAGGRDPGFQQPLSAQCLPEITAKVNLSRGLAIPTVWEILSAVYFQELAIGTADAKTKARRSGAQRGALENKLRPEVFLSAPLLSLRKPRFPRTAVAPASRRQPNA